MYVCQSFWFLTSTHGNECDQRIYYGTTVCNLVRCCNETLKVHVLQANAGRHSDSTRHGFAVVFVPLNVSIDFNDHFS